MFFGALSGALATGWIPRLAAQTGINLTTEYRA